MTPEQITALAREYAEWVTDVPKTKELGISDKVLDKVRRIIADDAERMLEWLLRRYYLADKEKAKAFYNGDPSNEVYFIEVISCRRILGSLFPDLGKEVEA